MHDRVEVGGDLYSKVDDIFKTVSKTTIELSFRLAPSLQKWGNLVFL